MLILARKRNTAVAIGDDILVTVQDYGADHVVLQVRLPAGIALRGPEGMIATQQVAEGLVEGFVRLKVDDDLQIGEDITVKAVAFQSTTGFPNKIRLGFEAPLDRRISRIEPSKPKSPEQPPNPKNP